MERKHKCGGIAESGITESLLKQIEELLDAKENKAQVEQGTK